MEVREWQSPKGLIVGHQARTPFAAVVLVESAQHELSIGAHEDLPQLPANILG
jgi:hypothetical protein